MSYLDIKLRSYVPIILHLIHDDIVAGHPGRADTLIAARKKFFWPTMKIDIFDNVSKLVTTGQSFVTLFWKKSVNSSIKQTFTVTYHPSSNGLVERATRKFFDLLRPIVGRLVMYLGRLGFT